ncbi:hypothetical protein ES708_29861 [subsurface metagenome]
MTLDLLHHAGFQPEFVEHIWIGIMYATVFRIGNSVLLIYPFFWGVGGYYNVLIKSEEILEIGTLYPEIRSIILFIFVQVGIYFIIMFTISSSNIFVFYSTLNT